MSSPHPPAPDPGSGPAATSTASLRESQELFAKSFHNSPALMTIAALPEGEFVEINAAFLNAVRLTREEVLGKTTLDLNLWRNVAQREDFIAQISSNITVRDFEAEFNSGSGEPRYYLLNADRIELNGRPCILTVAIDINERRRRVEVEEELASVERRYRNLFENAAEGLYLSSPEGKFLEVNPALARMLGYPDTRTCINSINTIDSQVYVDPSRRTAFFEKINKSDLVTDFESEIRRRDGSTFWVSESVRAVRDESGQLLHLEGVAVDITARREAALALAEARDAADEANRAKSQFLASMSHELRTPLNGILGFTQVLRRKARLPPDHRHGLDVIHESAEHLLGLINDVLDLSKVEAGRLEVQLSSVELPNLLSGVAELLGPQAREKGLGFDSLISSALPKRVTTDSARLRQVLLNLAANAVKFTESGTVTMEATCPPGQKPATGKSRIRFGVRDTGKGIAPADFDRLFRPFEQIGNGHDSEEGTGLGLTISHRLVGALGGQLMVESAPGEGSFFWFELELPIANETTTPFEPSTSIVGYEGPERRVLVVDDVAANADVLVSLLEPVGFRVTTARSGEEALERVAERQPDLVLMDLRMPGMGGLAAIKKIRANDVAKLTRVIAVSASAYDFDREQALAEGCDDFLPKPVRAENLFNTLASVLNLQWRTGAPHRDTPPPFEVSSAQPPTEVVEELYQFALTGDIAGLQSRAESLQQSDPAHARFAAHIIGLTQGFKLKAIRRLLEPLRETKDNDG
ncbi:MAG: PAS domain-containing hybrid sensor histidine kinase/response regulator [Synoicihabitans sp.]